MVDLISSLRLLCVTWCGMFHGPLTTVLNNMFWKRWRISMCELLAVPHSWIPYVQICCRKVYNMTKLFSKDICDPSELPAHVSKGMPQLFIFCYYVFSPFKTSLQTNAGVFNIFCLWQLTVVQCHRQTVFLSEATCYMSCFRFICLYLPSL